LAKALVKIFLFWNSTLPSSKDKKKHLKKQKSKLFEDLIKNGLIFGAENHRIQVI